MNMTQRNIKHSDCVNTLVEKTHLTAVLQDLQSRL